MKASAADSAAGTPLLDRLVRLELALLVFVVVLVLFPYIRDPAVDTKIFVYTWGAGILGIVCVAGHWWHKRPMREPRLFAGILLIFFAWLAIAGLASNFVGVSIAELMKFVPLLVIYFVAAQVYRTPDQVRPLLIVVCAAAGVSVAYGIFQHFDLDPFPWNPDLRSALKEAPGTFGNGNLAAHATVLCITMALYLAADTRKVWYLGFVALYLVHLELASQRGGAVGLAAAAAVLGVARLVHRRVQRPLRTMIVTWGIVAVLGAGAVAGVMLLKQIRTGVPYPISQPVLLRYHGYAGAVRMIAQHPLLGYGPGNYRYENPAFWTPFEQEHFVVKRKMNYRAHCDILEFGTEGGLPAAGLYFAFLMIAIYYGIQMGFSHPDPRKRKMGLWFAGLFCTFMVDGFLGFNARVPVSALLLFLMAGVMEGMWRGEEPARVRSKWTVPTYVGVVVLSVAAMVFQTVVFAGEMQFQRAAGAIYYKAYPEAGQFLANGEALEPWNWEFAFQRGEIALRRYDPQDAFANLERARQRNPYFPPILVGLAHANIMLAEIGSKDRPMAERLQILDTAASYAQQAAERCPPLPEAEDMLGRVACLRAALTQQEAGSETPTPEAAAFWNEAAQHLRRALELKVREPDRVNVRLARARVAVNDISGALDALIRAADANPANSTLWPLFYQVAQIANRPELPRQTLARNVNSLRKDGEDVSPGLEALASYWGATTPDILSATVTLAKAAANQSARNPRGPAKDNFAWAADILMDELQKTPRPQKDAAAPVYNLAVVYAAAGQWEKAGKALSACWKDLPGQHQAEAAVLLSQALTQLGQADQALSVLREAASRVNGNLHLQLTLARALAKTGNTAEARNEYALILSQFQLSDQDRNTLQQELSAISGIGR